MGQTPAPPANLYAMATNASHRNALSPASQSIRQTSLGSNTYNGIGLGVVKTVPCIADSAWRTEAINTRCHSFDHSGLAIFTIWLEGWQHIHVAICRRAGDGLVVVEDPVASFPSDNLIAKIALMAAVK
jgi:hypothetical protein